jgi:hypothetical protein
MLLQQLPLLLGATSRGMPQLRTFGTAKAAFNLTNNVETTVFAHNVSGANRYGKVKFTGLTQNSQVDPAPQQFD